MIVDSIINGVCITFIIIGILALAFVLIDLFKGDDEDD